MKFSFGITTAALVSTVLSLVHRIPQTNGLSKRNVNYDDWAGVAVGVPPEGETFITVIGTFVVPGISDEAEVDSAVTLWVGIGGYTGGPLVQAGINVEYAADGTEIYNSFIEWEYEGSPGPTTISQDQFPFAPGDTITVQVTGATGSATARALFTNGANAQVPFDITPADASQVLQGQNIEWVVERLPRDPNAPEDNLLAFGDITFTACAGNTAAGSVTFPSSGDAIDMLDSEGQTSATTAIAESGDAFTVTWQSA